MNKEKQVILKQNFPILFSFLPNFKENPNLSYTEMLDFSNRKSIGLGIECGDGWFDLIYNLSEKLENLHQDLKVVQIKEKFGTLRYYLEVDTEESIKLIQEAENSSGNICEICGKSGTLIGKGWAKARCEEHKEL